MSATYAGAKGKSVLAGNLASTVATAAELSDEEKTAIAGRVRLVKQHIPEAFEFMKALHAAGMVDGMRCLASVTVFEGNDHGAG